MLALFTNDRIKTVEARAKEIRPDVDQHHHLGQAVATCILAVSLSPHSATRSWYARYSRRLQQGHVGRPSGWLHSHHEAWHPQGRQRFHGYHGARAPSRYSPRKRLKSLQLRRKLPRRKKSLQRSLRLKRQPKRLLNSFSFIAFKGPVRRNGSFLFWCTNRLSVQFPTSHAPCSMQLCCRSAT